MKYDQIGRTYNSTRMPDERITNCLIKYLDQSMNSTILDIGAGSGNYSYELAKKGYKVIAVEPSEMMRRQGKQHERLHWVSGIAEEIPVESHSVDGVICTLATHHFTDLQLSFREMTRVIKSHGKIVIFTADPRICIDDCWIAVYFKEIVEQFCLAQPDFNNMRNIMEVNTNRKIDMKPFQLPYDLKDRFFFSGWRTPEIYLNEVYRSGISSLATAPVELLDKNLQRLSEDIDSGKWHDKYGDTLNRVEFDCGYFFLVG